MIVKTELVGGYIWIEHDDSVGSEGRIYVLHTQAPGHQSFAMGTALAREVGQKLVDLTQRQLQVGDVISMPATRRPTFLEWLLRKRVVSYMLDHRITQVIS